MKKIVFIIAIVFVSILSSCTNDEPDYKKNPEECAVTYFENLVLNGRIHCDSASYEKGIGDFEGYHWVSLYITDFDEEYLNTDDIEKKHLMPNKENEFKEKFQYLTGYNGKFIREQDSYSDGGVIDVITYDSGDFEFIHKYNPTNSATVFSGGFKDDGIFIMTNPIADKCFVSIHIVCTHGKHPHPMIKNATIDY